MSSLAVWLIVAIVAALFGGMIPALVVCLLAILIGEGSTKAVFIVFAVLITLMFLMGLVR